MCSLSLSKLIKWQKFLRAKATPWSYETWNLKSSQTARVEIRRRGARRESFRWQRKKLAKSKQRTSYPAKKTQNVKADFGFSTSDIYRAKRIHSFVVRQIVANVCSLRAKYRFVRNIRILKNRLKKLWKTIICELFWKKYVYIRTIYLPHSCSVFKTSPP